MEGFSLMDFNSPIPHSKTTSPATSNLSTSPGNNPFDTLSKRIEGIPNNMYITQSETLTDFQASPCFTEDFFKINVDIQNCGRESLTFLRDCDISGRESLGILKLETLNDFSGRESLGILKLETLNSSFHNNNLNIPSSTSLFNNSEDLRKSKDYSNSPLNTAFLHPFSYRKQSMLSNGSSVSPIPSLFNSGSLEASGPSKIYSLNCSRNFDLASKSEDVLNEAFIDALSSLKLSSVSNCTAAQNFNEKNLDEIRQRIFSLPVLQNAATGIQNDKSEDRKNCEGTARSCWSESEIILPLKKHTESSEVDEDGLQEMDEAFNDSVFIEAHHLASKIADGSILIGESFEENLLDCTSPPHFEDVEESEPDTKVDVGTIFKTIDKMLPLPQGDKNYNVILENPDMENNSLLQSCKSNNSTNAEEFKQNLRNMFNNKSENCSQKFSASRGSSSSGSSKCRDANELLQDLSVIINNEHRDSKKKIEGQQLLCSLADILYSDSSKISLHKSESLEDSGHSSIEQEEQNEQDFHECYEVLDLRVAASKSNDNEQVLDLSMNSKVQNVQKRLSQSLNVSNVNLGLPPTKLFDSLKNSISLKSSAASLELPKTNSNCDAGKLKPKKLEVKRSTIKKGPLKAVIPLGNMAKRKSLSSKTQTANVTPPKIEQAQSTLFKVKRTSTPIAEPQLKPVAQSTPDSSQTFMDRNRPISSSSTLKKRKFVCPISPLARPSSISDTSTNIESNKSNHSGSIPNLSNRSSNLKRDSYIPSSMYRRHSATELKVTENVTNNPAKLKRSYSIGKDLKTRNIISQVKGNISATFSSLTGAKKKSIGSLKNPLVTASQKNGALQEKNSHIASNVKSFNLLGKLKKSNTGKENIDH